MALWPFRKKDQSEEQPEAAPEEKTEAPGTLSIFRRGLRKTAAGLKQLFGVGRTIDADLLEELEVTMFEADFGPEMVTTLIELLKEAWEAGTVKQSEEIAPFLQQTLLERLTARDTRLERAASGPTVILIAGVNGTGKTTSIAKLANGLRNEGHTVLLAAADTFRAAAVEQLTIWSTRITIPLVVGKDKSDPAAVAFNACERAVDEAFDYLIVDTAGRLHTQANLMRELEKVRRVISNKIQDAPHETLLVLDATCGQNALNQAEAFNKSISLTGLIMAKLDGTAKGGILITVNNRFQIPIKFVGLGEKFTDLSPFDAEKFVKALFS